MHKFGCAIEYETPIYILLNNDTSINVKNAYFVDMSYCNPIVWHDDMINVIREKIRHEYKIYESLIDKICHIAKNCSININILNCIFNSTELIKIKLRQLKIKNTDIHGISKIISDYYSGICNIFIFFKHYAKQYNVGIEIDQGVLEFKNLEPGNIIECMNIYNTKHIFKNINNKFFIDSKNKIYYPESIYDNIQEYRPYTEKTPNELREILNNYLNRVFTKDDALLIYNSFFLEKNEEMFKIFFLFDDDFAQYILSDDHIDIIINAYENIYNYNGVTYNISMQLNITLPYNDNISVETFNKLHINWMKYINILLPLISAVWFKGETNTFNQHCQNPRSVFYVGDDIGMYTTNKLENFYDYQDSKYRARKYKNIENNNILVRMPNELGFLKNLINKIIKMECKQCDTMNNNVCLKPNYYMHLLQKKLENTTEMISIGADYRINEEYYKPQEKKFFGMEIRYIQPLFEEDMKIFIRCIVMVAEYVKDKEFDGEPLEKLNVPHIIEFISFIHMNGWLTVAPNAYLKIINTMLFNIFDLKKKYSCYDILNSIYKSLHRDIANRKFENTSYIKYFDVPDNYYSDCPDIPNINKKHNMVEIDRYFESHTYIYKKIYSCMLEYSKTIEKYDIGKYDIESFSSYIEKKCTRLIKKSDYKYLYVWFIDNIIKMKGGYYYQKYIKYKKKYINFKEKK